MFSPSTEKRHFWTGFGLVLLGAFGFSAKAIIIKLAYAYGSQVDAITLMALRMLFSLPIFLLVAILHNKKTDSIPLDKQQWLVIVLLGLIGYYVSSYLDFTGLNYISAGLERVLLFLYPTVVVLFSALAYKRKITAHTALALALSYSGTILVFIEQLSLASSAIRLGSALVLGSAVTFAFFTMGSGIMTHRIGSTRFTAYTMTVASIATLAHFAVRHGAALDSLPVNVYGLALVMAIFSTVLPAFFMNAGIRRIGAGNASIISTTGPISTLALAFIILHESITVIQLTGTCFVLAGVYIAGRTK